MATAESPPPELSSTGRAPKPWDKLKRRSRGSTQSASTPTVTRNAKNTNALRELNVSLAGGENGEGGGGGSGGVGAIAGGVNGAARGADVKTADRMTSREGEAGAGARASATSSGKTATSSGAKVQSAVRVNVNLKKPSTISSPAPGGSRDGGGMTAKVSSPSPPPPQTTSATTRRGAVKKMVIAQPADDKKKKQQQNEKEVVASGGGVSSGPAFDWLLQRQLEVEMSLRGSLLNSQEDLIGTRRTFAAFAAFFRELHDAAKTLGCASAVLFQELLHRVAGVNAGVSMDEQKRDGDVPMHQAKCSDMDAVLGAESVARLAQRVAEMRLILRVKMEDANDVLMAEEAVNGAHAFFTKLQKHAESHDGMDDFAVLEILRAV